VRPQDKAGSKMNLLEVLDLFAAEVPDFISSSVVSRQDGTSIGSSSARQDVDPAAADAYFTDMLNKNEIALGALGVEDHTEDILTTSRSAYFLTRILPETGYFWNVASGKKGSLGLTRAVMRKYESMIVQALP
jgi:hypothetical protein